MERGFRGRRKAGTGRRWISSSLLPQRITSQPSNMIQAGFFPATWHQFLAYAIHWKCRAIFLEQAGWILTSYRYSEWGCLVAIIVVTEEVRDGKTIYLCNCGLGYNDMLLAYACGDYLKTHGINSDEITKKAVYNPRTDQTKRQSITP